MVVLIAVISIGLVFCAAGLLIAEPAFFYRYLWHKRVYCTRCRQVLTEEEVRRMEREDDSSRLSVEREV